MSSHSLLKYEIAYTDLILDTQLSGAKSSFSLRFNSVLWAITTGSQLFLVWWYRRQPVFYLPAGWAPGIIGWVLSFPNAPRGEFCHILYPSGEISSFHQALSVRLLGRQCVSGSYSPLRR